MVPHCLSHGFPEKVAKPRLPESSMSFRNRNTNGTLFQLRINSNSSRHGNRPLNRAGITRGGDCHTEHRKRRQAIVRGGTAWRERRGRPAAVADPKGAPPDSN